MVGFKAIGSPREAKTGEETRSLAAGKKIEEMHEEVFVEGF